MSALTVLNADRKVVGLLRRRLRFADALGKRQLTL